ncbi:MAG: hypothetical protein ACREMH_05380 [Gemmatimonadales bacterium]
MLRALASIASELASGLSAEVSESEALRAQAYASLNQWDSAAGAGYRAIAALERLRSGHGSSLLRASFASFRDGTYGTQVAALLALGQTDEGFEVADAARGGRVQALGSSGQRAPAVPSSSAREGLLRRIGSLEDQIRSREQDGLDDRELRERLGLAQREYEITVLSAGSGKSRTMRQDGLATRVRHALGPDELMIAYLVTPVHLFVFTLTRQHVQVQVLPVGAAELEARVRLARQLLADPTARPAEADAVLGTLTQWLLGPIGPGVDEVRRLAIVPHGALAYLPFPALKTSGFGARSTLAPAVNCHNHRQTCGKPWPPVPKA